VLLVRISIEAVLRTENANNGVKDISRILTPLSFPIAVQIIENRSRATFKKEGLRESLRRLGLAVK
jgi:hypothetical protein